MLRCGKKCGKVTCSRETCALISAVLASVSSTHATGNAVNNAFERQIAGHISLERLAGEAMESSPLSLLRPELISLVLDFMDPHEHSAFSHTCRAALELVRRYEDGTRPLAGNLGRRAIELHQPDSLPPTGMDSSPLGALPPELVFLILDFMQPHEYSGLPCTCQGMLSIVNRKLDTPRSREFASRNLYVSRTAAFVKAEHQVIIWGTVPEDCGCSWIPPVEDGDSDL